MSEQAPVTLQELNRSLQIRSVRFQDIHSQLKEASFQSMDFGPEATVNWVQQFAEDDPLNFENASLVFRPRYSFTVKAKDTVVFEAAMIVALTFSVEDLPQFERCWADEATRKIFFEKQIMRLMWPILRQQLMDCMSRHSLPPIPLPWIV